MGRPIRRTVNELWSEDFRRALRMSDESRPIYQWKFLERSKEEDDKVLGMKG